MTREHPENLMEPIPVPSKFGIYVWTALAAGIALIVGTYILDWILGLFGVDLSWAALGGIVAAWFVGSVTKGILDDRRRDALIAEHLATLSPYEQHQFLQQLERKREDEEGKEKGFWD